MAFLAQSTIDDLKALAIDHGIEITSDMTFLNVKDLITKSASYDANFCKARLAFMQKKAEEEKQRLFELEKLKIQLEMQRISQRETAHITHQPRMDIAKVIPIFNPKENEIGLYLTIFERQLKFLNIQESEWIPYLISSLPTEIAQLIAREDEEDSQDYRKVKEMLLKRFRLTADRFRQLFSQHKKSPDTTWRDFYFEIASYFEGWITELHIKNFEQLKSLIISDQIKKKAPPDIKEHFVDSWAEWNQPLKLAEKLDSYENNRQGSKKHSTPINRPNFRSDFAITEKRAKFTATPREDKLEKTTRNVFSRKNPTSEIRTIQCYGCGMPGYIQSKCPTCSVSKEVKASVNSLNLFTFESLTPPKSLIKLKICGMESAVCADTGASHSVAGEKLFHMLQSKRVKFGSKTMSLTLADGTQSNVAALTTVVNLEVEGKVVPTELIVLPEAKGNRTLLGTDFLQSAGIVLDVPNGKWHFCEKPQIKYSFYQVPSKNENCLVADSKEKIAGTSSSLQVPNTSPLINLRSDEGKHLTKEQRNQLNCVLEVFKSCFEPGGEPTPFNEPCINTGNSPPVAKPPYRMNPVNKSENKKSRKIMPKRERPYLVVADHSPTTYAIANPAKPDKVLGTYYSSALRAFGLPVARDSETVAPLPRRGRIKRFHADSSSRRRASQRGSL